MATGTQVVTGVDPDVRAQSWIGHLRSGGFTDWASWPRHERQLTRPATPYRVPGAQHLELLRRLNHRAGDAGLPPGLADRVLAADATGRGLPDLPLAGGVEPAYGARPVDPATLPPRELLRVALGVLAGELIRAERPTKPRRTRFRRETYRLVGDPWLADPLRAALVADGRPPGGGDAIVYVLGADLGSMLVHAWLAGAFGGGIDPWPSYWRRLRAEHRIARRADLLHAADTWSARVGPRRVRVVLDPTQLPAMLRVKRLPTVPTPTHVGAELARRLGGVLGMRVSPDHRRQILGGLYRRRLEAVTPAGVSRLRMPSEDLEWVSDAARFVRGQLRDRDYPVIGDPDLLIPSPAPPVPEPPRPTAPGLLDLAMDLLVRSSSSE